MDAPGRSDLFQPGQSFGKFYLVQLIGEGGTSRIFKALQQPINRLVALKIPSFSNDGDILTPDEFLSEATLMARLEHGHVVRIYDFGVQEDKAFICMEYVEGWNLMELTESRGPLSVSAALAAAVQTLEGLLYAHSQDVLHLDLSPANVLVGRSGVAKLSDFGMAGKKFRAAQGRIVGTPAFLSPEHVSGAPGSTRSDLFSFGSLLYYLATGEPLFDPGQGNMRVNQALLEIGNARAAPPEDRIGRLPHLLAKPVLTALQSKDPEALHRDLLAAWDRIESGERPEAVLKRELSLDLDEGDPGGEVPAGRELRDHYFRLREGGRHREAVALLEKALRREPDNPLLRELLSTPPAKAKSAPVTVLVEASGTAGADRPAKAGRTGTGNRAPSGRLKWIAGTVGILAVTAGLLAWGKAQTPAANPAPVSGAVAIAKTGPAPGPGEAADAGVGRRGPTDAPDMPAHLPALTGSLSVHGPNTAKPSRSQATIRDKVSSVLPWAGRAPRHKSPAVALSGPAGTKVTIDDTAEWTSPSPARGWPLSPGLVNITLTTPGSHRPISSSLFVSADTLYLLSLEADGGFSVTRNRR